MTLESQSLARDFDIIAFSVSFEWDYTNILTMLRLAGVPVRAADRTARDPLVVIGGAITFVNPEPLATFADIIAAGEGEELVPGLLSSFREEGGRRDLLKSLAKKRGFYIPSFYDVEYKADNTIERFVPKTDTGAPPAVRKAAVPTTEALDPPCTAHLHARHRVRVALPRRGRPRLCQSLPLLLGRLQLPAGSRFSGRSHPRARARGARARKTGRPGVDRPVRPPGDRSDPDRTGGHGLLDQPRIASAR